MVPAFALTGSNERSILILRLRMSEILPGVANRPDVVIWIKRLRVSVTLPEFDAAGTCPQAFTLVTPRTDAHCLSRVDRLP